MLVDMLVRHDLPLQLRGGVMAGVAAEPVLLREFDERVREHALNARALDLTRGESVARDGSTRPT